MQMIRAEVVIPDPEAPEFWKQEFPWSDEEFRCDKYQKALIESLKQQGVSAVFNEGWLHHD